MTFALNLLAFLRPAPKASEADDAFGSRLTRMNGQRNRVLPTFGPFRTSQKHPAA